MNGIDALDQMLRKAGYASVAAAVAEHTIFLDPRTVEQTGGQPVFPVVRDMNRRGQFGTLEDGRKVLCDDNYTPTWTFLWAAGRKNCKDVQYNHVWTDSQNPELYTALWNLCATPAFLAKTTDGLNHPEVRRALQYRAYQLFGAHPEGRRFRSSLTGTTTSAGRRRPTRWQTFRRPTERAWRQQQEAG